MPSKLLRYYRLRLVIVIVAALNIFAQPTLARDTAIVQGIVYNTSITKGIDVKLNLRYLNGELEKYSGIIDDDGRFFIRVPIPGPMLAFLDYYSHRDYIFLSPGDTLKMEFIAQEFPNDVVYTGKGGTNNTLLARYFKEINIELNPFNMIQYRHGDLWLTTDPDINVQMQLRKEVAFIDYISERRDKALSLINSYGQTYSGIDSRFIQFMESEAYYEWAYYLLMYGVVYKNRHNIDLDYFDFLRSIRLDDKHISSHHYRQFLDHYLEYIQGSQETGLNTIEAKYQLATDSLHDTARAYSQSEVIKKGIDKLKWNEVKPIYERFLTENTLAPFNDKVIKALEDHNAKNKIGPAPNFEEYDLEGKLINLTAERGKPVFLYFWATWCKPCLQKMKFLNEVIHVDFLNDEATFIFLSLDESDLVWRATIQTNEFSGTHLRIGSDTQEGIAKLYGVQSIPKYFTLDAQGAFAESPPNHRFHEISTFLQKLIQ